MASTGIDTGFKGTIAFSAGISAFVMPFRRIGAVEQAGSMVEANDLSLTECQEFLPPDDYDPGVFDVEYAFDPTQDHPDCLIPGTITITHPLEIGQATAANLAGTGFIMDRTALPEQAKNKLCTGTIRVRFDGKTGPTLTAATDSPP